ncbi:hypothetical protein ABT298_31435 [Streptomyces sp. NPDC001034]|uniref:hypothetical protein n=1 Tax=Streptomyces sp. NPDC001034 TaxID=3154375 RepID=UPI00332D1B38
MSKAVVRRRVVAVALMAVGLAACGGNHGGGAATAKAAGSQRHEPSVRVLSQDQLKQVVVSAHDLPGIRVEKIGTGSQGVGDGVIHAMPRTNTHPDACAPVSAAVDGASGYSPVASVQRTIDMKDHSAILTLASYRAAEASRVIDELRAALRTCTAYQAGPMKATYKDVKATNDVPQGEVGVAFRLTLVMDPNDDTLKIPVSVIVTHQGSTVATYKAISDDPRTPATIPAGLVNAQAKVLDSAVHSGQ